MSCLARIFCNDNIGLLTCYTNKLWNYDVAVDMFMQRNFEIMRWRGFVNPYSMTCSPVSFKLMTGKTHPVTSLTMQVKPNTLHVE